MSYEGHVQALCESGHLNVYDCRYWYANEKEMIELSCQCGSKIVWENNVDDTNCESYGEIDMEQFLITPQVNQECPTCHHLSIVSQAVYRIPTEEERQNARCWRPEYSGTPLKPLKEET
jgi:hypothetical protein